MYDCRMRFDTTIYYYQYATRGSTVSLLPEAGGRYKVMFGDENLGSYHSPEAAADRGGSGCLNSFRAAAEWISALVMLRPGLAAAS